MIVCSSVLIGLSLDSNFFLVDSISAFGFHAPPRARNFHLSGDRIVPGEHCSQLLWHQVGRENDLGRVMFVGGIAYLRPPWVDGMSMVAVWQGRQ